MHQGQVSLFIGACLSLVTVENGLGAAVSMCSSCLFMRLTDVVATVEDHMYMLDTPFCTDRNLHAIAGCDHCSLYVLHYILCWFVIVASIASIHIQVLVSKACWLVFGVLLLSTSTITSQVRSTSHLPE